MRRQLEICWLRGPAFTPVTNGGVTALIASAYQNHLEVARLLIEAGADVNVKDDTQQSAYLIPTADGYLEFLKLTLQSGLLPPVRHWRERWPPEPANL